LPDDDNAEHKSAKIQATRRAQQTLSADRLARVGRH
jgi:hypothetical protein